MTFEKWSDFIHKAAMYGASKIGLDESHRIMDPLVWYISTGRASYEFTARLAAKKPYRVFQVLHKAGGSYDDAIQAIKQYLDIAE